MAAATIRKKAAAHEDAAAKAGLSPIGAILFWEMRDTATPHDEIASLAIEAGYNGSLPVPVSGEVSFTRAINSGCSNIPRRHGRWQADVIEKTDITTVALLQCWDPTSKNDPEPWKGRARLTLVREQKDPAGNIVVPAQLHTLPLSGFTVSDSNGHAGEVNPLRVVINRIAQQFSVHRDCATAVEIRQCVEASLSLNNAVKVKSTMWFSPGKEGAEHINSVSYFLRSIGNSDAGSITMFDTPDHVEEASRFSDAGLSAAVQELFEDCEKVVGTEMGAAPIRNRLRMIEDAKERLKAYNFLIGSSVEALENRLKDAANIMEKAANKRELDIDDHLTNEMVTGLKGALQSMRLAASARNPEAMKKAAAALRSHEGTARVARLKDMTKHLRKYAETVTSDSGDARWHSIITGTTSLGNKLKGNTGFGEEGFADVL